MPTKTAVPIPSKTEGATGHLYLAHGSNMDPERLRGRLGADLLDPVDSPYATVVLPESLLMFRKRVLNGSSAADLALRDDPASSPAAEAVVWRVSDAGLAKLDVCEGVAMRQYRRESWTVFSTSGVSLRVCVYLAEPEVIVPNLLPRRRYLQHVLTGANRFLSAGYADWIARTPVIEDHS